MRSTTLLLFASICFAVLSAVAAPRTEAAQQAKPTVAVLGIIFFNDNEGYQPTSPEERARLVKVEDLLKSKLADSGRYTVVPVTPQIKEEIKEGQTLGECAGCEYDYGKTLGVQQVAWVKVQKVTNLILNMTVLVGDVSERKLVFARAVDIRSNSDESWLRSMNYILKNYLLADDQM